jgi:hypothetical protein
MVLKKNEELKLPESIIGAADITRLLRELSDLDDFLAQAKIRASGGAAQLPRTTRMLDEAAKALNLDMIKEEERTKLKDFLQKAQHGPVMHMSFAAEPSPQFLHKIIAWFRTEINPLTLLQIGLQPGIAAGCILRTPNHYFDLSLQKHFKEQQALLFEKLGNKEQKVGR